jgi:hypothetical protein
VQASYRGELYLMRRKVAVPRHVRNLSDHDKFIRGDAKVRSYLRLSPCRDFLDDTNPVFGVSAIGVISLVVQL